jgi:hypothetical protein
MDCRHALFENSEHEYVGMGECDDILYKPSALKLEKVFVEVLTIF